MVERILVTGGAGYIGSHVWIELLEAGYQVVCVDNLSNAPADAPARIEKLAGQPIAFHQVDLLDKSALEAVFEQYGDITGVIHFAALKGRR